MAVSALAQACDTATFAPSIFGTEVLSLEAQLVANYSVSVDGGFRQVAPSVELENATFCNVTVSYTHPGQNDNIIVEAWLPTDNWNSRLQAVGGGGYVAGRNYATEMAMYGALADGFATITTDAGLGTAQDASGWALLNPGNVNLYNIQNLASTSLNDEALIGKSLIKSFYGRGPEYSYWTGCSQGGRQGLMLAQRYPTAYDGISAGAPAIWWTELFPWFQWAQQVMNQLGQYPYGCELDAITTAAISACDVLDGVTDRVIARVDQCRDVFDPFSQVGKTIKCAQLNATELLISKAAAIVVNASWQGIITERGKQIYHGIMPGTDLTGNSQYGAQGQPVIAKTNCTSSGCVGVPGFLGTQWLQLFVAKNPSKNLDNLTRAEYEELVHRSQQYASIIGTADPDLTDFRDAGGKMITFHGLADEVISPKGTEQYYEAVTKLIPDIHNFYRYFEAPGLGHCVGGPSGQPDQIFRQLQDWVERGIAPESTPVELKVPGNETHDRILCPYPEEARLNSTCGNAASTGCWSCVKRLRG
ncbi:Tannase/feruloyl esterase [Dactylonectria estremocensis]|uniref:Carboxylic ester hydrolase n=1 Tax=Dactylonectria estremocensis TaxID=1079267 RepID=A0A9P9DMA4_9HYPO|nr:Tannase/feruloyl esterase [Dactylonectria estremocensis]